MGESAISSYQDLRVWREAMDLTEACYLLTRDFPRDELFGLTSQIRRAAVSIPANIAESYGREQTGTYTQALRVAQGSLKELETHLLIVQRISLASPTEIEPLLAHCEVVGKMLRGLIRSVQATGD